jgi:hypothetical protein
VLRILISTFSVVGLNTWALRSNLKRQSEDMCRTVGLEDFCFGHLGIFWLPRRCVVGVVGTGCGKRPPAKDSFQDGQTAKARLGSPCAVAPEGHGRLPQTSVIRLALVLSSLLSGNRRSGM